MIQPGTKIDQVYGPEQVVGELSSGLMQAVKGHDAQMGLFGLGGFSTLVLESVFNEGSDAELHSIPKELLREYRLRAVAASMTDAPRLEDLKEEALLMEELFTPELCSPGTWFSKLSNRYIMSSSQIGELLLWDYKFDFRQNRLEGDEE